MYPWKSKQIPPYFTKWTQTPSGTGMSVCNSSSLPEVAFLANKDAIVEFWWATTINLSLLSSAKSRGKSPLVEIVWISFKIPSSSTSNTAIELCPLLET